MSLDLKRRRTMLLAAGLALGSVAYPGLRFALAQTSDSISIDEIIELKPVYHKASDRYFQFVPRPGRWMDAEIEAYELTYKGRRGRLAIIDSLSVHEFLVSNFPVPFNTWIGLRYMCPNRSLVWTDGTNHQGRFKPWARPWSLSGKQYGNCGNTPYMPVYYTRSMRWQASGWQKGWRGYFVEYPTAPE